MSTIQGNMTVVDNFRATGIWSGIAASGDVGTGIGMSDYPDRTVQVGGTFGSSTIIMEGSNDGTNWSALHDFAGNAISLTDTSLKLIAENPYQIRFRSTAGSAASLTVIVHGTR